MTAAVDETFTALAQEALRGLSVAGLDVLDAQVEAVENGADVIAWRVVLALPRPSGDGWSVEATRELKRAARQRFDGLAEQHGRMQEGLTGVLVTMHSPEESDLAAEDDLTADDPDGTGTALPV